jgi:hypothetical protein
MFWWRTAAWSNSASKHSALFSQVTSPRLPSNAPVVSLPIRLDILMLSKRQIRAREAHWNETDGYAQESQWRAGTGSALETTQVRRWICLLENMVARDGVEPPAPAFSALRTTSVSPLSFNNLTLRLFESARQSADPVDLVTLAVEFLLARHIKGRTR